MVERRVLVCTDGAAGHHAMTREATAARRWVEQKEAAELGGFEVRLSKDRQGRPFREARLHVAPEFFRRCGGSFGISSPTIFFALPFLRVHWLASTWIISMLPRPFVRWLT